MGVEYLLDHGIEGVYSPLYLILGMNFKSGMGCDERPWWVRFPCASANIILIIIEL